MHEGMRLGVAANQALQRLWVASRLTSVLLGQRLTRLHLTGGVAELLKIHDAKQEEECSSCSLPKTGLANRYGAIYYGPAACLTGAGIESDVTTQLVDG